MNFYARRLIIVVVAVIAASFALAAPESRVAHAASLSVNSTADTDDGTCDLANCTLREAINEANANGTNDTIAFSFPGVGPWIIQPASQLPTITERVTITGSFTTGYAPFIPVVWIDGSLAGAGASGFVLATNNAQIYGLAIYDFDSAGVYIDGGNSNLVGQSVIGTNALEQSSIGNEVGVLINSGSSNGVGFSPSERNIISGNGTGVRVFGGSGNFINDNYIGLKRDGATPLGNGSGIYLDTAPGAYVLSNVISGNGQGIAVEDDAGVTIENNKIGLNAAGTAFVPNSLLGIYFFLASGTGSLQMNEIRGNGGPGIALAGSAALHSHFTNNIINDNAGLGIDIGYDGVTANDSGDADGGPNGSQNYPVITGVTTALGSTTVQASLNSTPSTSFAVDFYASTYCDPSGHGEGRTYLGSHFPPNTNVAGDVSFTAILNVEAAPGSSITATATGPEGTSEFSLCFDIPLDPGDDQDLDGCQNAEEIGPDEGQGGQRDPENPWDFYDVNGTQKVDSADIGLVRSKFNQDYPPYDRSPGDAPWAPDGPDGIVNGIDIGLVRTEFNHDCRPDI